MECYIIDILFFSFFEIKIESNLSILFFYKELSNHVLNAWFYTQKALSYLLWLKIGSHQAGSLATSADDGVNENWA